MFNIISSTNLENINFTANEILKLIKAKKFFFTSKYDSEDIRVKASSSLIELSRSLKEDNQFTKLTSSCENDISILNSLTTQLSNLLLNRMQFMTHKLKDYSLDIKIKLCRELVSELEDLFVFGDITRDDINHVYETLSKPVPKKFSGNDLKEDGKDIYRAIRSEIKDKAELIKANSIQHYIKMVNLIDPEDTITSKKEFFKMGRRKLSDFNTLRLCLAYKFNSDFFHKLINDEFDLLLTVASNQISHYNPSSNENPEIIVRKVKIGGKGFDILMTIDGNTINARAIPVQGDYVRFHYRYIITNVS
jgi:hypothetical protein